MQTPKAYVIELSERMEKLANDIRKQGQNANWQFDRVRVNITNPHPTIEVLLDADNESQITLPDMRAFSIAIDDEKFAIAITLSIPDWSYGELDYYDTLIAMNTRYDEREDLFEQAPAFELPEDEKPYTSDINYMCFGKDKWRLSEIDPRTIDELQANHPTTFNILKVAARRTGQQIEKLPELKPITPEEISGHLKRMHKAVALSPKAVKPLKQHHFYRVDKSCSRRQQFYHVVECLGNYPMLNNNMDTLGKTKGVWTTQAVHPSMWSLTSLRDDSYTHYNVRRRHEHFSNTMFPHITDGWVSLTPHTITDVKSSSHCEGYEVYISDENGTLIAWGYTDDTVEDFVSDVEQFLQLYGKCAIMK